MWTLGTLEVVLRKKSRLITQLELLVVGPAAKNRKMLSRRMPRTTHARFTEASDIFR